uniref:TLC domain-containing protein n=1 Tax=Odontella aurita TaxID=265563 RepID=A0A7S4J8V0_9STRA|mmetsp:Transcript_41574/g.126030  ORF Transcript_41574/g.126030 Transcript_41574/m.126030 type:complete len:326 (+) Transcript_41574:69-1046(+)|eukprot:CAMPEP_0113585416 /NCGR_PEP_ID=MMETSP0015_2-20120614/33685_1 /TAXON_ID=2838 /ORGANISM="Odontella" /LENGTH=325 /DNA_ID=CAMNT_0000490651 /DNA_START=59 /DNA_END=1036 /DNA_ORIENTATION=+ /assembly_acc=CAM_ASM_000160
MCNPTAAPRVLVEKKHSLLLTTSSFGPTAEEYAKKTDGNSNSKDGIPDQKDLSPTVLSTVVTIFVVVLILRGLEHGMRYAFEGLQNVHPVFEVERNRHILARHIGVDFMASLAVSWVGVANSHVVLNDVREHAFGRSDSMSEDGYRGRMFTYRPAAQRILLLFLGYQVKNTYDSYVWNDGIVFIFHHLLSGVTAWGGMFPGLAHFYAIFFMGISEISTMPLCLLANFDDEFGVVGLGDAFPLAKVAFGALFAVTFIVCRCVIWPVCTHYFIKDCKMALKCESEQAKSRRKWIKMFMTASAGLSALQIVFLGQIIYTVYEEIVKVL